MVVPDEWDVVLFREDSGESAELSLGRVAFVDSAEANVVVDVLEPYEDADDGEGGRALWTPSEVQKTLPLSCLHRVMTFEYSQRMEADRVSNPHGEHAVEVFSLPIEPL
jgi:hypothetical protein